MTTLGLRDLGFVGGLTVAAAGGAIQRITYTTSQITSDATNLFGGGGLYAVASPVPYGFANNTGDQGWIVGTGGFTVDLGANITLARVAFFSTYGGADRGAIFNIKHSNDGASFTTLTQWEYRTTSTGGRSNIDSSGQLSGTSARTGWYAVSFNPTQIQARYWRLDFSSVTLGHPPRTAEVWLFGYA